MTRLGTCAVRTIYRIYTSAACLLYIGIKGDVPEDPIMNMDYDMIYQIPGIGCDNYDGVRMYEVDIHAVHE